MKEIETRLAEICRKTFRQKNFVFDEKLTPKDVKGWDSFSYILLIVNIEKEFGVKLPASQVSQVQNLGGLVALIQSNKGA